MPKLTENYQFKKPLGTESVLISVLNENFDGIDNALAPEIADDTAPTSQSTKGKLAGVIGWLANRIKAITGKAHWYEAPKTNLETVAGHLGARGSSVHGAATSSYSGFMSASDKAKLDKSTASATASAIMLRDSSGRAKVVSPSNDQDIANKNYVDTAIGEHKGKGGSEQHPTVTTSVPGFMSSNDKSKLDNATPSNTAGSLIMRDSSGRAKVANPSSSYDIANKNYVDSKFESNNIVVGTYEGDGTSERTISLGFTPKCVVLMDMYGNTNDDVNGYAGGIAMTGKNCIKQGASETYMTTWDYRYCILGIVAGGFKVSYYSSKGYSNVNGRYYYYIAFK